VPVAGTHIAPALGPDDPLGFGTWGRAVPSPSGSARRRS